MLSVATQRRLSLALVVGLPVLGLVALGLFGYLSPRSSFLPPAGPAAWIDYPVPPRVNAVVNVPQHAVFRRAFNLEAVPASARLRACAFKECSVYLNGQRIDLPGTAHWKEVQTGDVAPGLKAGPNDIRAVVTNDVGPPVLWLCLEGPGWSVESDVHWNVSLDGATECSAHLARRPPPLRPGNPAAGGNRTMESVARSLPALVIFAFLSTSIWLISQFWAKGQTRLKLLGYGLFPVHAGLLAASLLWMLLFSHNTYGVPLAAGGFDSPWHLKYIQYIQAHQALPLAQEGWEMHQPPLYYALAAGLLWVFGLRAQDSGALVILRLMGLAAGLVELALVAASLRLLFPQQPRRQVAGLALASFLPVHIYMCHYVTNETLAATLSTAALYLCLRVLQQDHPSRVQLALLGLVVGAALLTKVTAVVVAVPVFVVLAGRLVARRQFRPATWLRVVGLPLLVTLLVSGWHYARVWSRFGAPLVGNYDAASGYGWWQDPGYAVVSNVFGFGRSLVDPFFSALDGLPDGLYSTLWGDGLCGGMAAWSLRPPWNYDLMAATYLLALVPSVTIASGLLSVLIHLVRQPRAEWLLLLGVAGGLAAAVLFQFLRYPYYGHAKAFYCLIGMLTLCALGAWGVDLLARLGRLPATLLIIFLGIWACAAYASFWIRTDSPATHDWNGLQYLAINQPAEAENSFRKSLAADPHYVPARLNLAIVLLQLRHKDRALLMLEQALRDEPDNPQALWLMGKVLQVDRRPSEALEYLRRASELAPDHSNVHSTLGDLFMEENHMSEAITAYRNALRVSPAGAPADHANLGLLLARTGQTEEALAQYRQALRLRNDHAGWSADLAWMLATAEDSRFLDPREALRLAEEASHLTEFHDPLCIEALAAAQAAGGQFRDGASTARRALQIAQSTGQFDLVERIRKQIQRYEEGKPISARPPLRTIPYPPVPLRAFVE